MSGSSNKMTKFWLELKRRKVLRSLAIYAGSAFIILEAATIIFPRWGFPDWTIDLVLYLLILGVFINIVIAWIFDITPEGVQKTKPIAEVQEYEKTKDSKSWKLATYISLVVIVGLIVFNVVPLNRQARGGPIDSILILPFDNFTGDDQLDNMISAMHSLLIGDLGRIQGLRVISPTTSNVYKDADMSIPEIAEELGVRAIMDLDVMCMGDTFCFQTKVINADPKEELLWIADYKEEKGQMLNLYNLITKQIAEEVKIKLSPEEEQRLAESRTVDPEALEAYLKGQYHWEQLNRDSIQKIMAYFQLATELDPRWADPYAGLAQAWGMFSFFELLPKSTTQPMKDKYLKKALELDPNSAKAHYANAGNAVWSEWDWEKGEKEFLKSIELNPNDALTRIYYAHLLMILRRTDEAVQQANIGLKLDPSKPIVLGLYSVVMAHMGDYESSIDFAKKAISISPEFRFAQNNLLLPYYLTGDYDNWIQAWVNKVRWSDEAKTSVVNAFNEKGHIAAIEEMFRLHEKYAPEDCYMGHGIKANRYLHLNQDEKALDHIEKNYEMRRTDIAYLRTNMYYYHRLKDNPRYIALLKKMNLPLPKE